MNTRKYPRTLQEAFGPYTSRQIDEPVRPFDRADKIVMFGAAVAFAVLCVLMIVGAVK